MTTQKNSGDAQGEAKNASSASDAQLPEAGTWTGERDRRRPHPLPRGRRTLMMAIILGVLTGFIVLVWLVVDLRLLTDKTKLPAQHDLEHATQLFKILAAAVTGSALAAALWVGHFGWRVRREKVYPPPGSRHLRVRKVLRDAEAQRVAYVCFVLAALLVLAALAVGPLALRLLASLRL